MPTVDASVLPGEGTLLQISISGTFTTIAQVAEVGGPAMMVEAVDKTVLSSTLIIARPSRLAEPDKVTAKIYYDPNDNHTQSLLSGDSVAPGTIRLFKIVFVDGNVTTPGNATFSGFVTKFSLNGIKVKENIGADIEIQPTTIITFTAGTA